MVDDSTKKAAVAQVFSRTAQDYSSLPYFPHFGGRLVEAARMSPGARVLDVACGRGAVLFAAAERVGPEGRVVGIDLTDQMVEQTKGEIAQRGLRQAEARVMDAEHLDFPDEAFDFVLCGFALFFFPRVERALAEFRRVLRPGGRVAASTWDKPDSRWGWYDRLLEKYEATVALRSHALDTPDELRAIFDQASFTAVEVLAESAEFIYPDEAAWWATRWALSSRVGLARLSPERLDEFKREAFAGVQAMKAPDGIHHDLRALIAVGAR